MSAKKYIAIFILLSVSFWVLSGVVKRDDAESIETSNKNEEDKQKLQQVEVQKIIAKESAAIFTANAVTRYNKKIDIKSEASTKVQNILVKENDFVKKDQVLIVLETREKKVKLMEAEVRLKQAETNLQSARELFQNNLYSESQLAEDEASLALAKANLKTAQLDYDNTLIKAPFSGKIDAINVEVGDLVGPGQTNQSRRKIDVNTESLITIIDIEKMIVRAEINENKINKMDLDESISVELNDGKKIPGKISYISNIADDNTRTFTLEVEIDNNENISSGMTAQIHIPIYLGKAHRVQKSSLTINDSGELGIKYIQEGFSKIDSDKIKGKVSFSPISIESDFENFFWVTGIKEDIFIISLGQGFVKEGDEVIAVLK